ncbi:NUDIX hydrolase [Actinocorallia libanotica]|uniref:NUDIX hydrolase n=1 Tax=Actinocorallia libanotica TaxID=46162 RepID=A0ABN1Q4A2_9ACTN
MPELFVNPEGAPFEIIDDPARLDAIEAELGEDLARRGLPASWGRVGVVYEDPYGMTLRDAVRRPDGSLGTYTRRLNPGNAPGVVILPVCSGEVVLLRHFRHSTRQWHLELPRGYGTPGAVADDDARRELLEELGALATALVPLGVVHPDTGQMSTAAALYYAEIEEFRDTGEEEGIGGTVAVAPAILAELIRTGGITDGFTVNAYAQALLRGLL